MIDVNTYGLKIVGLKEAVAEMPGSNWQGEYLEVFYDTETGNVITHFQVSIGENSWTEYNNNPEIIKIGNYTKRTAQELATDIHCTVTGNFDNYNWNV